MDTHIAMNTDREGYVAQRPQEVVVGSLQNWLKHRNAVLALIATVIMFFVAIISRSRAESSFRREVWMSPSLIVAPQSKDHAGRRSWRPYETVYEKANKALTMGGRNHMKVCTMDYAPVCCSMFPMKYTVGNACQCSGIIDSSAPCGEPSQCMCGFDRTPVCCLAGHWGPVKTINACTCDCLLGGEKAPLSACE